MSAMLAEWDVPLLRSEGRWFESRPQMAFSIRKIGEKLVDAQKETSLRNLLTKALVTSYDR